MNPVSTTFEVTGMTCGHCAQAVTAELSALPGVRSVVVDLAGGRVDVTSDAVLPIETVRTALDEAGGYTLT